jgi:hypothetical protein
VPALAAVSDINNDNGINNNVAFGGSGFGVGGVGIGVSGGVGGGGFISVAARFGAVSLSSSSSPPSSSSSALPPPSLSFAAPPAVSRVTASKKCVALHSLSLLCESGEFDVRIFFHGNALTAPLSTTTTTPTPTTTTTTPVVCRSALVATADGALSCYMLPRSFTFLLFFSFLLIDALSIYFCTSHALAHLHTHVQV